MIIVDLLKPSTLSPDGWLKPIEFEITDPPTLYVRVPHGRYAVRVMTTADAEVLVHVDGVKAIEAKVTKGIHIFDKDSEGNFFTHGETTARAASEGPELVQQTLFGTDEVAECVKTHGQVSVHVRFCDVTTGNGKPILTPDFQQPVFFQMNAPGAHEEACASLLRKLKAPPKLTAAEDIFGEHKDAETLPQRHCCNCPHEHNH
jgi:hypothetical protein